MAREPAQDLVTLGNREDSRKWVRLTQAHGSFVASGQQVDHAIRRSPQLLLPKFETLGRTTRRDLNDRATAKEHAISLFNANSEALYDAPGNLIIEVGKNGYQFEVEIQRTGATGMNAGTATRGTG